MGAKASRATSEGILGSLSRDKVNAQVAQIVRPTYQAPTKNTTVSSTLGGLVDRTAYNTRAADRIAQDAMRTGPSAWRGMMDQQMATKYSGMGDQLAQQQAGQLGQARSSLAMRGGLRGGSAERLASQGMQGGLLERQRLARSKAEEGMGYNIQDELNRQAQLGQLGTMDANEAQFRGQQSQFNLGNAMQTLAGKNQFAMDKYREEMQSAGAARTADAIRYGK